MTDSLGLSEVLRLYGEAALTPSRRPAALRRLKEMAADLQVDPDVRAVAQRYHDDLDSRDITELNAQLGGLEELRRQLDAADAKDEVDADLARILAEHGRRIPPAD